MKPRNGLLVREPIPFQHERPCEASQLGVTQHNHNQTEIRQPSSPGHLSALSKEGRRAFDTTLARPPPQPDKSINDGLNKPGAYLLCESSCSSLLSLRAESASVLWVFLPVSLSLSLPFFASEKGSSSSPGDNYWKVQSRGRARKNPGKPSY